MNPILRMLMTSAWSKGVGDRFDGALTSDFKNLTDAYAAYKHNAGADSDKAPQQSPIDRIKAAFDQLKDMHKGPDQTPANMAALASSNQPFDFESAHWPVGPVGAPSQSMASAPPPPGVPMPRPRPPEAPQESPMMSLFQRSAAMQQDPNGGGYIDPATAAKAQPNIFHGLFG